MKYKATIFLLLLVACEPKKSPKPENEMKATRPETFADDRNFLKKYKEVVELGSKNGAAKILIVNDYQARVMTSTADGDAGNSYGWINYDLIKSGEIKPHMNPVGGEDRFWLGPEGGQFALYFKKGGPFDFDHWQTPSLIDSEPFEFMDSDSTQATFKKKSALTNYSGFTFQIDIQRKIKLLTETETQQEFDIQLKNLKTVAYQSTNSITNSGAVDWSQKNGLLSIWILGMFTPSDNTIIVLPHQKSGDPDKVTDNYFGTIPPERILKNDSLMLLKGDGKYRGKVGIAPSIAKNIVGSYNSEEHILTLVKFDLDQKGSYVNSKWEMQKEPFSGDAVNSYNDGPVADGSQLGPFYEIESSSPARALKRGETLTHRHTTLHLEGDEAELSHIAEKTLGVSLKTITIAFQ